MPIWFYSKFPTTCSKSMLNLGWTQAAQQGSRKLMTWSFDLLKNISSPFSNLELSVFSQSPGPHCCYSLWIRERQIWASLGLFSSPHCTLPSGKVSQFRLKISESATQLPCCLCIQEKSGCLPATRANSAQEAVPHGYEKLDLLHSCLDLDLLLILAIPPAKHTEVLFANVCDSWFIPIHFLLSYNRHRTQF